MKILKNEFVAILAIASLIFAFSNLNACKKKADDDDSEDAGIDALVLNLDASCDGEPCL